MSTESPTILADLHSHSMLSDGELSPNALLAFMKSEKVSVVSITDHDCLDAYDSLTIPPGVNLIPGVEFSVRFLNLELHVLGYFPQSFLLERPAELVGFLQKTQQNRWSRGCAFLQNIGKFGITVNIADVKRFQKGPVLSRYHLAQTLSATGYTKSVKASFKKYLEYNKPHMDLTPNSAEEVINLIHRHRGIAIWAHPAKEHLRLHLDALLALKIDGLEMVPMYGPLIHELKKKHQILVSYGSDFHRYRNGRKGGLKVNQDCLSEFCQRLSYTFFQ